MIDHLTIIGVGLIGGSLSLALKQAGYVKRVTGCGRSEGSLQKGLQLGVLDEGTVCVHGVWLDSDDIRIIGAAGAG